MRLFTPGLQYFLLVFGAGFALAFIRIPFLVPQFGVRTAELMELPVMLAVIYWASRRLIRRHPALSRTERLGAGLVALSLLVGAELLVAWAQGHRSPAAYIASRDAVAGTAYLLSLLVFAAAPALGRADAPPPAAAP